MFHSEIMWAVLTITQILAKEKNVDELKESVLLNRTGRERMAWTSQTCFNLRRREDTHHSLYDAVWGNENAKSVGKYWPTPCGLTSLIIGRFSDNHKLILVLFRIIPKGVIANFQFSVTTEKWNKQKSSPRWNQLVGRRQWQTRILQSGSGNRYHRRIRRSNCINKGSNEGWSLRKTCFKARFSATDWRRCFYQNKNRNTVENTK